MSGELREAVETGSMICRRSKSGLTFPQDLGVAVGLP
jgi:hypothetical protein